MIDFRLYLITDRSLLGEAAMKARLATLISGGVRAIQIREKDLSAQAILELSTEVSTFENTQIFLNDRIDIALAAMAHGVHLPENSWMPNEVRKIEAVSRMQRLPLIIGKSTHSLESALRAEQSGADFITFGPIFETPSKQKYGEPLGLEALARVTRSVSIPVFALGGMTPTRSEQALDCGAFGVGVISDLLLNEQPLERLEEYRFAGLIQ